MLTYYDHAKSAKQRVKRLEVRYPSAVWATDMDKNGYFVTCQLTEATVAGLAQEENLQGVRFLPVPQLQKKEPVVISTPKMDAPKPKSKIREGTRAHRVYEYITSREGTFDERIKGLQSFEGFESEALARDWARYVIKQAGLDIPITYATKGRPRKAAA